MPKKQILDYNMINLKTSTIFLFILIFSCGQAQQESDTIKHMNHLQNETSPYLLQHVNNPVDWYPWGEEALNKAKKENKLIIISVGYAACHWCHVMEDESFENNEVATIMNEHFISIKVDREERPDIDQVYMEAIQLLNGSGGWPLNAITLPDGRPFVGGTYFTKEKWIQLLNNAQKYWSEVPEKVEEYANNLTKGIQQSNAISADLKDKKPFIEDDFNTLFSNWSNKLDHEFGGLSGSPKFPMPSSLQYLFQYYAKTDNQDVLNTITKTLDNMGNGGIYDQIGGGFARYSTDIFWKVPHFEKMLYDNGQLVSLYANAYRVTKDERYKQIVYETLAFTEREFCNKKGGYYSSLDADSEGEEGKFYVWTKSEIEDALGKDAKLFIDFYHITEEGNWEHGKNIPVIFKDKAVIAEQNRISIQELDESIAKSNSKLLKIRDKRIKPSLDDKTLTSWNALMLNAYVDAYRAFNDDDFLKKALKNAQFIQTHMLHDDGHLDRNYKNGASNINGFLDDYANTIHAFINLYQATFDEHWLNTALDLTNYTLEHFFDSETGFFFYTSNLDKKLIARKKELDDNVMPSSNSVMGKNLFMLGHLFYRDNFIKISENMTLALKDNIIENGAFYSNWASLSLWQSYGVFEVAITGKDCAKLRQEMDQQFLPNVIFMGGKKESNLELLDQKFFPNETIIFVCKDKSCQQPTSSAKEALGQLKN